MKVLVGIILVIAHLGFMYVLAVLAANRKKHGYTEAAVILGSGSGLCFMMGGVNLFTLLTSCL